MTNRAMLVNNYNFTSEDKLFLDANIWLYIYGPQKPRGYWTNIYSQALARILTAKSHIFIDVLIVSEFINVYARQKFDLVAPKGQRFKNFRKDSGFKPVAQDIAADVKRVLSHCSRIESGFATMEKDDLLSDFAAGKYDFNDQVIAELCKREGLTLITNDGDFRGQGIPVLTANQRLLA